MRGAGSRRVIDTLLRGPNAFECYFHHGKISHEKILKGIPQKVKAIYHIEDNTLYV